MKPGRRWRILAHGKDDAFAVYSNDYKSPSAPHPLVRSQTVETPTVFDELVIDHWFHLEQMDNRIWWLRIGEDMVMVTIGKDGKPKMGEWYK